MKSLPSAATCPGPTCSCLTSQAYVILPALTVASFHRTILIPDLVRSVLRKHRIKYVAVHALTPHGRQVPYTTAAEIEGMDTYLRDVVGLVPIFNDSSLTVYRNPQIE